MSFNLLDAIAGGSVIIIILLCAYSFLIRASRYSWKARVAWAVWLLWFPVLELFFALDGDPATPTLSELGVDSFGQWMVVGALYLGLLLALHWRDLAQRMGKLDRDILITSLIAFVGIAILISASALYFYLTYPFDRANLWRDFIGYVGVGVAGFAVFAGFAFAICWLHNKAAK